MGKILGVDGAPVKKQLAPMKELIGAIEELNKKHLEQKKEMHELLQSQCAEYIKKNYPLLQEGKFWEWIDTQKEIESKFNRIYIKRARAVYALDRMNPEVVSQVMMVLDFEALNATGEILGGSGPEGMPLEFFLNEFCESENTSYKPKKEAVQ